MARRRARDGIWSGLRYDLLEAGPVNFVGNVEGRDIGTERADVIVTDGFTGNIFIKTMEGAARMIGRLALEEISALDPANSRRERCPHS